LVFVLLIAVGFIAFCLLAFPSLAFGLWFLAVFAVGFIAFRLLAFGLSVFGFWS
jgi:hypothetical protein